MKLRSLLEKHVLNHGLCPGSSTLEHWLQRKWLAVDLEGQIINVFPIWPNRQTLQIHDVHHVLTEYDTSPEGEFEVAAWELGSGGCGYNLFFWFDRIVTLILGLVVHRKPTTAALKRGRNCRNLYGQKLEYLLDRDIALIRADLRIMNIS